jgi:hypothetical protein
MTYDLTLIKPCLVPPLDPDFCLAVLVSRAFQNEVTKSGGGVPAQIVY